MNSSKWAKAVAVVAVVLVPGMGAVALVGAAVVLLNKIRNSRAKQKLLPMQK